MRALRIPSAAIALAILPFTAACSKGVQTTQDSMSVTQTPTGAIAAETYSMTATVTAIDASNRKLTLQSPDGNKTTFKASPDMVNFPQIQVGDQVNATVTEQVAISVWKMGAEPADGAVGVAALTPVGAKPGGVMVATQRVTGKITAIDAGKHKVTFLFADGSTKTIKVDKSVNLSNVAVGDNVTVQITEAAALTVTKQ